MCNEIAPHINVRRCGDVFLVTPTRSTSNEIHFSPTPFNLFLEWQFVGEGEQYKNIS